MSGFLRGVDDVARRRAWLFMLPDDGLYRSTFVQAQSCSLSWSFRSLALLQRFRLSDWPEWKSRGGDYASYLVHIRSTLERVHLASWNAAVQRHILPVPYKSFMAGIPSLWMNLPWTTMMKHRSIARLRCGLVDLGHLRGRRSRAKKQCYIFCDELVSQLWVHTFCLCPIWKADSNSAASSIPDSEKNCSWALMRAIVSAPTDSARYASCAAFIDAVVCASDRFWRVSCRT